MTAYITHSRYKKKAICGRTLNLPYGTELTEKNGLLFYDDKPVCCTTSEAAHRHFARNDDGRGLERGALTQAIQNTLRKQDDRRQERWDRLWADCLVWPYRRKDHEDFWIWNQAFFDANIETLRYIAKLVDADTKGA